MATRFNKCGLLVAMFMHVLIQFCLSVIDFDYWVLVEWQMMLSN